MQACSTAKVSRLVFSSFEDIERLKRDNETSQIIPNSSGVVHPKFVGTRSIQSKAKTSRVQLTHMLTSYINQEESKKSLGLIVSQNKRLIFQPQLGRWYFALDHESEKLILPSGRVTAIMVGIAQVASTNLSWLSSSSPTLFFLYVSIRVEWCHRYQVRTVVTVRYEESGDERLEDKVNECHGRMSSCGGYSGKIEPRTVQG